MHCLKITQCLETKVILERRPLTSSLWVARARPCFLSRAEEKHVHTKLDQLIADDPAIGDSLEKVRQAAALVADIQAQRAAFDEEFRKTKNASPSDQKKQEQQQAQRAAGRGANEDIMKAADELERANAAFAEAEADRDKWAVAATEQAERLESGKAAGISGLAAAAAGLPFAVASSTSPLESAVSLAVVFLTGLLFGVTYRYAVRQDRNPQLQGGVVAAFGLARGSALAEDIIRSHSDTALSIETLAAAALLCGESIIIIAIAAAALEFSFQQEILRPFGAAPTSGT